MRFNYPDQHIEVDNRLSWFLGELGERFDSADTFYVHLTRDTDATARSFVNRWTSSWKGSIISAFAHGILMSGKDWDPDERLQVSRFYVSTVHANIREFLRNRPSIMVELESPVETFSTFLDLISAEGDLEAAKAEWATAHNAS